MRAAFLSNNPSGKPRFNNLPTPASWHVLCIIRNREKHHELTSEKRPNDSPPNRGIDAAALKRQQTIHEDG